MAISKSDARRRVLKVLRSRRTAVWLLAGLTVYISILTVTKIPMPYSNPVFVLAVVWLTASTTACAWERTAEALRPAPSRLKARGGDGGGGGGAPSFTVELPSGTNTEGALRIAESAFAKVGLRAEVQAGGVAGRSNSWTRWASPLFHWALVVLFSMGALGPLMKADGTVNVPAGGSVVDEAGAYDRGSLTGPLFLDRYTGARIAVQSVATGLRAGGSERGNSPFVVISSGGRRVASAYVYPNNPAQWGPLTVHQEAVGPAVLVGLRFPNGQVETSIPVFLLAGKSLANPPARALEYTRQETGERTAVEVRQSPGKRVVVSVSGTDFVSAPLEEGGTVTLPDGTLLTISRLTEYARLRVINDWTIPYLFTAFVLLVFAPMVGILWPSRRALAWIVPAHGLAEGVAESGGGAVLAVRVYRRRSDPSFSGMLRAGIEARIGEARLPGARKSDSLETEDEQ